jgi:hypothetical protein
MNIKEEISGRLTQLRDQAAQALPMPVRLGFGVRSSEFVRLGKARTEDTVCRMLTELRLMNYIFLYEDHAPAR